MSQPGDDSVDTAGEAESPPITGLSAVDEALARLAELDAQPVAEHHETLSSAHETLHDALQPPREPADG